MRQTVGLGGSCHWCTEAIFASLIGVVRVEQGWFKIADTTSDFSEAVRVTFDSDILSLTDLIAIHIDTHSATEVHSMRHKYRSAVYTYSEQQALQAHIAIHEKQNDYSKPLIVQVLAAGEFKHSPAKYQDYYYSNPHRPFCEMRINPKLSKLLAHYRDNVDLNKLSHLIL
ncbi:peptide methionine sulfoxide reductase [Pseudoalteromonas sp. KS88]|uniref:peptide-methionine (S)-S-oxide reductase n=1 Tax=Pseudoalteromonas sp. KS88 TaxID=2109918 RepID=UPI001080F2CF|nr:peptide-methionine (S)-S-oxide reductase [Pseudoalteromonas sp. KS88]TGE78842.1 peptide methionine sulfoxide reductase [Pseudoalteromonas sp. KS88]